MWVCVNFSDNPQRFVRHAIEEVDLGQAQTGLELVGLQGPNALELQSRLVLVAALQKRCALRKTKSRLVERAILAHNLIPGTVPKVLLDLFGDLHGSFFACLKVAVALQIQFRDNILRVQLQARVKCAAA
jgi:hypothetical protein